jgi:hypothetical protein
MPDGRVVAFDVDTFRRVEEGDTVAWLEGIGLA